MVSFRKAVSVTLSLRHDLPGLSNFSVRDARVFSRGVALRYPCLP